MREFQYPLSDLQILVTGGAGFIGHHLVAELAEKNDVRVLDNLSTGKKERIPDSVELIEGDLREWSDVQSAVYGTDLVYHLGAIVSVTRSQEEPLETWDANVSGTSNVLEAARLSDAAVVFASSAAVYGDPATIPIDETVPPDPQSPYGFSKLLGERYLRFYSEQFDLPAVSLRFFNVYGSGQTGPYAGVINTFMNQASNGEDITVHGEGDQTRDFINVADVVRACEKVVSIEFDHLVYNIGTGSSTSILDLAELIAGEFDYNPEITFEPPRRSAIHHSCSNIDRAASDFGFNPSIGLTEGIAALSTNWQ